MSRILVIEAGPSNLAGALRVNLSADHVISCGGSVSVTSPCALLRDGDCPLVCRADLIVFSLDVTRPLFGRAYGGWQVLSAYRRHPQYSRLPMIIVGPRWLDGVLDGRGEIRLMASADPEAIVLETSRLLAQTRRE